MGSRKSQLYRYALSIKYLEYVIFDSTHRRSNRTFRTGKPAVSAVGVIKLSQKKKNKKERGLSLKLQKGNFLLNILFEAFLRLLFKLIRKLLYDCRGDDICH